MTFASFESVTPLSESQESYGDPPKIMSLGVLFFVISSGQPCPTPLLHKRYNNRVKIILHL